jgi:Putative zinc-finger
MNFHEFESTEAIPEATHPVPETCLAIRSCFSEYLDGAVTGRAMHSIAGHLESCSDCTAEFASWRAMQQALSGLRSTKAPANLGLKLRCAISQQKARRDAHWADKYIVRWENAVRPMLIQVSAGLAGAIVLVGSIAFLLGIFAAPQAVLANDVPLDAVTAPHYLYSAASPRPILTDHDTTIVVDAAINDQGQVYDYRIVSAPNSPEVQKQIAEQLMLYVFEPARIFGSPVRGRVIVTFDGISVRG